MSDRARRLGRGLEALIPGAQAPPQSASIQGIRRIPLEQIRPNPFQPRREFDPDEIAELENSMRAAGLLQPVTVRSTADGAFQLVAGERRVRAATRLGWSDIPAIVSEVDDQSLLTLALIENLQRADLNPLDEAEGYHHLMSEFGLTQQQVSTAVGKDRSTVANMLRLLKLPDPVQRMLRAGQLTVGHARALLALPNESSIVDAARSTHEKGLTVRDVERMAQSATKETADAPPSTIKPKGAPDSELRRIIDQLRRRFQTDVQITADPKGRGEVRIRFYSAGDLNRLLELLNPAGQDY
jgi:ParB family transcriptional regulator, chromosome partitioning protein